VAKATDSTLFAGLEEIHPREQTRLGERGPDLPRVRERQEERDQLHPEFTTTESLNYADKWDVYSTPKVLPRRQRPEDRRQADQARTSGGSGATKLRRLKKEKERRRPAAR
jgi:hypothetical protein